MIKLLRRGKVEKLLPIIVQVYNGASYLEKCLTSFIDPSIEKELEVIVVDDGSEDATSEIADSFCKKYPLQFRLEHKLNGGHGSAINTALPLVQGKYMKAIDADDWVITENLCRLIPFLRETEADAVVTEFDMIYIQTNQIQHKKLECPCGKEMALKDIIKLFPKLRGCFTYHGLFFKTAVYRAANFQLSEGIFYEDHEYATLPFAKVKTVLPIALSIYQYRLGDAGQSVAFHNQVRRISHIGKVLKQILDYKDNIADFGEEPCKYFLYKLADILVSFYAVALVKNPNKREGRKQALEFRTYVDTRCPELNLMISKKYRLLWLMNRLHIPASFYQWMADTGIYGLARQLWGHF